MLDYTTSNFFLIDEINKTLKRISTKKKVEFLGVFSRDNLPVILPSKSLMFIINLGNTNSGGSHWTCVFQRRGAKFLEYFDSMGMPPPEEILKNHRQPRKNIIYNTKQVQGIEQTSCGYHCLYFLKQRLCGIDIVDIIFSYSNNFEDNEKLVVNYK